MSKKIVIGELNLFVEEENNKLGIENWKKLAKYGVKLHNHVRKVAEDNRFTFWEKIGSIKYIKGGWDLARLGDQLNEERKDFTASEFQEIIDIVDEQTFSNFKVQVLRVDSKFANWVSDTIVKIGISELDRANID